MQRSATFPYWSALAVSLLLTGPAAAAQLSAQSLAQGWQFHIAPKSAEAKAHPEAAEWRAAEVPGSVQTDLLKAGVITDPFYRDNEARLQWIGLADWDYRLGFKADPATLKRGHVELVFDGLDTYADVTLNGRKLVAADNMFRRWRVPVKGVLRSGENKLEVHLHSPIARLQPWLLKQPYALPGEFDSAFGDEPKGKQSANYIRKANYQYGWDWGPRYVTLGIWQPVRLESWDDVRMSDVHIAQQHVDADVAELHAEANVQADQAGKAKLTVSWSDPDGSRQQASQDVELRKGDNALSLPIRIEHPRRWWPVGYGAQDMYRFEVALSRDGATLAAASRATGLRSVELRRDKDQWGRGFAFVVNGVPVFAKGANLIPFDSFPNRATPERMAQILRSARDANMNMLRMWGGGHYQSDAFYEEADRLGLMIWQDFMFGGAIPPYDEAFRENTRIEAVEQVRRLRDHPSIVLWCGNNEVQTGWEAWDDRKKFKASLAPDELARIESGMKALFGETLRSVVRENAPDVPYWASSPSTDYEGPANQLTDGDYHSWSVWSGSKPIEHYLSETPRFQSEYGLQSFPVMATVRAFAEERDLEPNSPVMRAHQKFANGDGNDRLLLYIRKYYGEPKDFESFVYLSQVMQAEGIELAAEHLRSVRPQAMGSLYWQLNDVWPGASWSSVDYFGRWKALQFHARRFYAPVRVVAVHNDGRSDVFVVSDRTEPFQATLRSRVMSMDGRVLRESKQALKVAPLASAKVASPTDAELLRKADPAGSFAVYELVDDKGRLLSRHLLFAKPPIELKLPDPDLKAELRDNGQGGLLVVSARRLAREVWVDFGTLDAAPEDNAFDLLPGETRELRITSEAGIDALRGALHVRSLAGATKGDAKP
ncbi:glycoside hydrolase family 2 protein [Dyella sp. SG609]|uniref:beta-mannosidase n=1 Tax=Dyella sp. SG609 TaxID=2587018 RepID=UPI001444DCFB|nr:glycoside hydrolase family 2 protein [Dyella sp. SG609]NKJ19962.1 beta-mannosidase [Dyella sp. SG609]